MILILSLLVVALVFAIFSLNRRVIALENSRQNRVTRIYNQEGKEVINRWTDCRTEGHWVTITTDVVNHKVLYAEHTRTELNVKLVGGNKCIREEHEYNESAVWGRYYKTPITKKRNSLRSRLQNRSRDLANFTP